MPSPNNIFVLPIPVIADAIIWMASGRSMKYRKPLPCPSKTKNPRWKAPPVRDTNAMSGTNSNLVWGNKLKILASKAPFFVELQTFLLLLSNQDSFYSINLTDEGLKNNSFENGGRGETPGLAYDRNLHPHIL